MSLRFKFWGRFRKVMSRWWKITNQNYPYLLVVKPKFRGFISGCQLLLNDIDRVLEMAGGVWQSVIIQICSPQQEAYRDIHPLSRYSLLTSREYIQFTLLNSHNNNNKNNKIHLLCMTLSNCFHQLLLKVNSEFQWVIPKNIIIQNQSQKK